MNRETKKMPTGVTAPSVGTCVNNQLQDTSETLSRQELKQSIAAVAMTIAGLRRELTNKFGGEEAYRMLIKMFQLACMGKDTIHAEARAAELYFEREEKEK